MTLLFQGYPRKTVNPRPAVGPTRQGDVGGFLHIALLVMVCCVENLGMVQDLLWDF